MDQYSEFACNGEYEIKAKGHLDEQWSSWFEGLTIAIFREREYPNRFGFVFVAFAVLLVLYVLLLAAGPPYDSPEGIMVQAVGQKIIVYASVTSIFIQASGARQIAGEGNGAGKG